VVLPQVLPQVVLLLVLPEMGTALFAVLPQVSFLHLFLIEL
jgi:hypothetical protein